MGNNNKKNNNIVSTEISFDDLKILVNNYLNIIYFDYKEIDFDIILNTYNVNSNMLEFNNIYDLGLANLNDINDLKIISNNDYFTIRYVLLLRDILKLKLIEFDTIIIDKKIDIVNIDLESIIKNKLNFDQIQELANDIIKLCKHKYQNCEIDNKILSIEFRKNNFKKLIEITNFLDKYIEENPTRPIIYDKYIKENPTRPKHQILKKSIKNYHPNVNPIMIINMANLYVDELLKINWIIDNVFNFYKKDDLFDFCYKHGRNIIGSFYYHDNKKIDDISIEIEYDFFFIKLVLYIREILKQELNKLYTIDKILKFNRKNMRKKVIYYVNSRMLYHNKHTHKYFNRHKFESKIIYENEEILENIKNRSKNDCENLITEYDNIKNINIVIFLNLTQNIENKFKNLENKNIYLPNFEIIEL